LSERLVIPAIQVGNLYLTQATGILEPLVAVPPVMEVPTQAHYLPGLSAHILAENLYLIRGSILETLAETSQENQVYMPQEILEHLEVVLPVTLVVTPALCHLVLLVLPPEIQMFPET